MTNSASLVELSVQVTSTSVSLRAVACTPDGASGGLGSTPVTEAVPVCPPAEALTVVDPTPTPVTRPEELTLATAGAVLDHVTVELIASPRPLRTVAES